MRRAPRQGRRRLLQQLEQRGTTRKCAGVGRAGSGSSRRVRYRLHDRFGEGGLRRDSRRWRIRYGDLGLFALRRHDSDQHEQDLVFSEHASSPWWSSCVRRLRSRARTASRIDCQRTRGQDLARRASQLSRRHLPGHAPHALENAFKTFGFNSRSAQTSGHHSRLFHSGGVALLPSSDSPATVERCDCSTRLAWFGCARAVTA